MNRLADLSAFDLPAGARCVSCGREVSNRILDRAGTYTACGQAFYLCFDCAVLVFNDDEVAILRGTYKRILASRPWEQRQRVEILAQLEASIDYYNRPTRVADDQAQYDTLNDRCKYWIAEEKKAIQEYRDRRLAGQDWPIPAPVDFSAPIPKGARA